MTSLSMYLEVHACDFISRLVLFYHKKIIYRLLFGRSVLKQFRKKDLKAKCSICSSYTVVWVIARHYPGALMLHQKLL